jgi:hypothetical protein
MYVMTVVCLAERKYVASVVYVPEAVSRNCYYQVSFVILGVCSLLSGIRNFKSPYKLELVAIF